MFIHHLANTVNVQNMRTIGVKGTVVTRPRPPLDLDLDLDLNLDLNQPNRNLEVSAILGQQETKFITCIPPEDEESLLSSGVVYAV